MKKTAIVNLSTKEHHKGQTRLKHSLQGRFDGQVFLFDSEYFLPGCPKHSDNPYAFKIYAIEYARMYGYDQILWLDASVFAIKPVQPIFDWIEKNGLFMEEAGHLVGSWCPENVREYFKISRTSANNMPMFSAGFTGIDFTNPAGLKFFELWKKSMLDGMFKGSWANHRHDMTCGSIIANLHGYHKLYSPGGNFFAYAGPGYTAPNETVLFHVQGI